MTGTVVIISHRDTGVRRGPGRALAGADGPPCTGSKEKDDKTPGYCPHQEGLSRNPAREGAVSPGPGRKATSPLSFHTLI